MKTSGYYVTTTDATSEPVEPVKISLFENDLKSAISELETALRPKVIFTGNLEEMQQEANEKRVTSINNALSILDQYFHLGE